MIRLFIGYDFNETVAYHVLSNSVMRHAKEPVSITPLILSQLPMTRERTPTQSTEFSFSRFLVPWLCGYEGRAIFMDCDMLVRADIAELLDYVDGYQVACVQHDYTPKSEDKFLGQVQTAYEKKNWSSLMVFDNEKCKALTPEYVNTATGLELHQFKWANSVGSLPAAWNHLVGEYAPNPRAKNVHFTLGTPCFAKYANCEYAHEWREEKKMLAHHNPIGEFSLPNRVAA